MTGLGTSPVARQRSTRSGSQTIGRDRLLGVFTRAAGLAMPAMMPSRRASLKALRRVARMRERVASPVGRLPATLLRTALHRIAQLYPDSASPALTQLRAILVSDPAKRITSAKGLKIRNRCVHYEMNDPRLQPNLTMPMCGLVEGLLPGHTWASVESDVNEVTAVVAELLASWRP